MTWSARSGLDRFHRWHDARVTARSIALFVAAAIAEIGGAYLVWQAMREGPPRWYALGSAASALFAYGFAASLPAGRDFGRILAAYGGIFVAGSLALGRRPSTASGPDRWDIAGA